MNKIIILLLTAYISFMACGVKKQISRSAALSDNLHRVQQQRVTADHLSLGNTAKKSDSLFAAGIWQRLSADSIDLVLPDTFHTRMVAHGIRWKNFNGTVSAADNTMYTAKAAADRYARDSAMRTSKITERTTTTDKQVRPLAGSRIVFMLTGVLVLAAVWYIIRKKIFPFP